MTTPVLWGQFSIEGVVVEAGSGQALEFATVAVHAMADESLLAGTTTDAKGFFSLDVSSESVFLKVYFVGFETLRIDELSFENGSANLEKISLGLNPDLLDEVLIQGDKSTTVFKLDKRVFNVGTDLSSTGASALEVLNNVPSVNVDIEGAISLRGATGVQILLDGKPTVLADESSNALGTITADMIDRIEVITNPSAKYEAEGTAGIINIILKKNEKEGLNGSVSLNTGIPHNHSIGFSMNKRTQNFNLFTQLGVGYRELPRYGENINIDYTTNEEIRSEGIEYRNETFYNVVLGTDYYISPRSVITLSGSFAYEVEDQPSETDFTSYQSFPSNVLEREWSRSEVTEATNPKIQYELQYKRDFENHKEHKLLFSAIGRYFGKEQSSVFSNVEKAGNEILLGQETATKFEEGKYTFNLDYTLPFKEVWTLETGAQFLTNDVNNDFEVRNENEEGTFVVDPNLTNLFEYNQDVLGVYSTIAYERNLWGLKLGLRLENTDLNTLLVNTNESNSINFNSLFPSVHTSYKLTENISFQAGYSRRILRPRLWDLNPFFNIRNNFNIRNGNPDLLPEFTDSYETGAIFIYDPISFNINVFHRYTTDKIERVVTFLDGVSITTPENIGTDRATGLEGNFKYSPHKKLVFNGDALYSIFKREGQFNEQSFDFSADQWNAKLTTKYKLSKAFDTELSLRYESEFKTIQGTRAANAFADFGFRYKILKNRGVFNFSVRDIFASRVQQTEIEQDDYYTFSKRQRGRFVTLGFSYGFGKGEAMQYSGNRRRH